MGSRLIVKVNLIALALLAFSPGAFAQVPRPGGELLQQIPPAPAPQRAIPEIRIEPGKAPAAPAADHARVLVRTLTVSGHSLYPEPELVAIAGFVPGREVTIAELRAMAARIAEHYHKNGYFVAQAYLPAQDVSSGRVNIVVLEGRYGNIVLRNQANLSDSTANGILDGLKSGDTVAAQPLESRLLQLSDIPGITARSTLGPGSTVGASDLIVELTPGRSVTGSVEADNAGNRYTGQYRVGGTVNFNNPTGHGDVLSFRGMTSGSGLKYGRASYQTQVGRGTVGVAYTALDYKLGKEFTALQAHGEVRIASIFASYPLIRSRNTNLYAVIGFDAKEFEDRVDSTAPPTLTERKANVFTAGLHGNHRDGIGGGGLNRFSLSASAGEIDNRTPAALAADAATARSNGSFNKLAFFGSRLQTVSERLFLYAAINGQLASKNLDISEKMGLGGMYGVRAYPTGEAYGDEGYLVNLEARYRLGELAQSLPGQVYLIGFIDTGRVTIDKNPWAAGNNHRTLSAAGIGLTWAELNNFSVSMYWAHKLGNAVATSAPDRSSRFWIHGIKYF